MGTIWVKEFIGGLDARRLPETTSGGVLIKAEDGHITRGGEFEQRAAFVREYVLPAGTVGLAAGKTSLYVFGSDEPPTMPSGVQYQRLQHPDGVTELVAVPSYDLYAGKIYAVGEFADGGRYHFYDGVRVPDWYDGRARVSFDVVSGSGGSITGLTVDGVSIITGTISWATSNSDTAQDIADNINSTLSTPEYTATAVGETVNIVADEAGSAANGRLVVVTTSGGFTISPSSGLVLAGGSDPVDAASASGSFEITGGTSNPGVNRVSDIQIDGVSIISGAVNWATSNDATAAAVASAINSYVSSTDYTATSAGAVVTVTAVSTGTDVNGKSIVVTVGGDVTVGNNQAMSGGRVSEGTYEPGTFVRTIGSRMHSVSGQNEHFSGINQPTKWTTDTTGAGFIDMSTRSSGSEELTSLAKYQNFVAVFSSRVVQIWYFDSDPEQNEEKQTLFNTGTDSPRSVTQFGDNDLFYLDESGIRSLRARDSSNSAATTDIGVPIDPLVVDRLRTLSTEDRKKVFGVIEPGDGRFWLSMLDRIYVFSYFQGAKISAWSMYNPTSFIDGEETAFTVDEMVVYRRKVYIRSGSNIFVYGGLDDVQTHDATEVVAWLPYLDAGRPADKKEWRTVDVACSGTWAIRAAMEPTNLSADDTIATVTGTTYNLDGIASLGASTHISLRFSSSTPQAKLGAAVIRYGPDKDDD